MMFEQNGIGEGSVELGSITTSPAQGKKKVFHFSQLALRVFLIAFTLSGAVLTITTHQTVTVFKQKFSASYAYSPPLKYKVVADSIACALTVLSVVIVTVLNGPKPSSRNYFYLLLIDLVSQIVLLSGCAAATAIGYVAKFGQSETGWMPMCNLVTKFCNKLTMSVVLSYLGVIILVALIVMSGCKLKLMARF